MYILTFWMLYLSSFIFISFAALGAHIVIVYVVYMININILILLIYI
jgi:hypothetical protein